MSRISSASQTSATSARRAPNGAPAGQAGRPLRVIHALKHGKRGNGSVHIAVDLACAQADSGLEVWFAAGTGSYDDLLTSHGVRVVAHPEPSSLTAFARGVAALLSLVRSVGADIVHAHMMSSSAAAWLVTRVTGVTLVTTLHNSFDSHWWLMRAGKVMVAVSNAEHALLMGRGVRRGKVRVVRNGTVGSAREKLPADDLGVLARPGIIAVSGLHGRKGVDDLIRAFAIVVAEFPHWHLNIVGWGPDRDSLEAQVEAEGLRDSVHFLGPSMTPWVQLEQAEIFASASVAEPFGLNVAEARAAGCAIVVTAVGGVPEVVDHGRAGLLVPPSDPVAMAAALRSLMADPAELARWRQRATVGTQWLAISRVAAEYEAVYREALPARRERTLARAVGNVHREAPDQRAHPSIDPAKEAGAR